MRQLPRFDPTVLEHFLDELRPFRQEIYQLFKAHPELLVAEEEGLSKGGWARGVGGGLRGDRRGSRRRHAISTPKNLRPHACQPPCTTFLPAHHPPSISLAGSWWDLGAEEHRELVRRCLRTILGAGYSPLGFFARDHKK